MKATNTEKIFKNLFIICGFVSVVFVIIITAFLIISGVPAINKIGLFNFLLGTKWEAHSSNPSYGILAFILTSLLGTFSSILIALPLGIFCSVFICRCKIKMLSKILTTSVNLLAGIPSVVYGLVAMMSIVPFVRKIFNLASGSNLFSAIIVLCVMILPTLISVSVVAINSVSNDLVEASLAMGASETETTYYIIIPAAKRGILTAIILAVSRSMGEAMAVMMVAGNVANMPKLFRSVRFITTAIASEMSYSSGLQRQALFSIALVLFAFVITINYIIHYVVKKNGV